MARRIHCCNVVQVS